MPFSLFAVWRSLFAFLPSLASFKAKLAYKGALFLPLFLCCLFLQKAQAQSLKLSITPTNLEIGFLSPYPKLSITAQVIDDLSEKGTPPIAAKDASSKNLAPPLSAQVISKQEHPLYDMIFVLEGPKKNVVVWQKQRHFGAFINKDSVIFSKIPALYFIGTNRNMEDIAPETSYKQLKIGFPFLEHKVIKGDKSQGEAFWKALSAGLQKRGLYVYKNHLLSQQTSGLFTGELSLPASAALGSYHLHFYLFENGALKKCQDVSLTLAPTKAVKIIRDLAEKKAFFYGLFAVLVAIITSVIATYLFKKK